MSRQKPQLAQLLFSSSHHDDTQNHSHEQSFDEEIENCEQDFLRRVAHEDWRSADHADTQFMPFNGPSVEFSQNFSQNSLMLSHRQDEDSRDYQGYRYKKLLEEKKREEEQFNEVLDRELTSVRQELERSRFEGGKLQGLVKGLETKVKRKEEEIRELDGTVAALQEEIDQLKEEKAEYLESLVKKDDFFMQHRNETTKIMNRLSDKEKENHELQSQIDGLQKELERMSEALAVYGEPDRRLLDFRGYSYEGYGYDAKKQGERELEKVRKEKSSLEIELSAARDKLEDRESRYKIGEEEGRKKLAHRERKIQELEQKIAEQKDEHMKTKTQLQLNLQKVQNAVNGKNKEITTLTDKLNGLNDRIIELQKKNKQLVDETKKKDDRLRELTAQIQEKGKVMNERDKTIADLQSKQDFDHHVIEEKDKLIEKLQEERRNIKSQVDIDKAEKIEKVERMEKGEREKIKREMDKLKKDCELTKKSHEAVEKERDEAVATAKESRRKLEELTKKWSQLKTSHAQLEAELQQKIEQLQEREEAYEQAVKQQAELKKRGEAVGELRNKIIILQSRLKQNESQYRDNSEMQSMNLQDKLDALQVRLEDKEKQLKMLRNQLRSSSMHSEAQQDFQMLQIELEEREQCIERLQAELSKKQKLLQEMKRDLEFKDHTLDFTHKILVNSEKAKIELEQEKKMLEEMLQRSDGNASFSTGQDDKQELIQFYDAKVRSLEGKLQQMERRMREKEEADRSSKEEYKFENRQLKERIRELNDTLLSKGKLTPETMSQEETASFLLKTVRRVNKSADMLRLLGRNPEFREAFSRMERELKK